MHIINELWHLVPEFKKKKHNTSIEYNLIRANNIPIESTNYY